jgi:transcription antitermination factor NusA-like protein
VKAALCNFCLKSGILCSECQRRLKSGEVSKTDLEVARLLLSLEDKYPSLQNVYFHKAVEANSVLAVIVGQGDVGNLLAYGGKIVRAIGEKMRKRVRVLEYGAGDRKFLEDLFAPLSVITINTIWLPDGTTETRVILKRRRSASSMNLKALRDIAQKVRGMTLRVEFARR